MGTSIKEYPVIIGSLVNFFHIFKSNIAIVLNIMGTSLNIYEYNTLFINNYLKND